MRRIQTARSLGSLFSFLIVALSCISERPAALRVGDAVNTHSFAETSRFAVSPDGIWVASVVRDNARPRRQMRDYENLRVRRGVYAGNLGAEIWLSNIETGTTEDLTRGRGTSWDPSWSPDGELLAFLSDSEEDGQARLWIWNKRSREVRQLSSAIIRADSLMNRLEWTPDSRSLVVTTLPEGMTVQEYTRRVLAPETMQTEMSTPGATVTVYESGPGLSAGGKAAPAMVNLDASYLRDLAVIDIQTGKTRTAVHGRRISAYTLSSDGSHVAYISPTKLDRPGSWQQVSNLLVLNLITGKERRMVSNARLDGGLSWSPDGLSLAYRACTEAGRCDFYVVAAGGGAVRRVSHLETDLYTGWRKIPLWDAGGKSFYFIQDGALWRDAIAEGAATKVATIPGREIRYVVSPDPGRFWVSKPSKAIVLAHDDEHKQDGFFAIDLMKGTSETLLERGQCYTCKWPAPVQEQFLTSVSRNGKAIVFVAEDAEHPPDLWSSDPDFVKIRRLTHLNPQFENYDLGRGRLIGWISDDGNPLQGAVLLPPDYMPGRRYPLVVWVYLGAHLSDNLDAFGLGEFPGPFNFQLLATRGYVVLLPDCEKARGDPGNALLKSILPGVTKLVESGIADPERIGLMGHSLGGFSTLALLVRTSRFRAAMEADSFADVGALHGMVRKDGTGFQYNSAERLLEAQPWQNPAKYIENSPYYSLDRIGTPLLIVHGSEDSAASVFLGRQTFAGLRRLNKPVEYAEYSGEGHVPRDWDISNQIDLANRILRWMDRYLKPKQR